jgi:cell filamentation protein
VSENDPYTYPGSGVLRNKFGLVHEGELDVAEREAVAQRAREAIPTGIFDLAHLQAIHLHLFQDMYEWAGRIRTVEISKGGHQFQFRQFIETGMLDMHRRLREARFLSRLDQADFAAAAGAIIGDVNYVHPFRDSNGRTQLIYLKQLAENAGHPIDLALIDPRRWLAASKAGHMAEYGLLGEEIGRTIVARPRRPNA